MDKLWLFLKGIAMGAADVVPGVSGGTVAFITGIYTELLDSIKSINLEALRCLFQQGPMKAWQQINGTFLLVLGSGIVVAILSLAKGIHHLLETYPIMLWSFFFGLILASSVHMGRQISAWSSRNVAALVVGVVCAAAISLAGVNSIEVSYLNLFVAGAIAITAMILPGISGSFILLLMGLYAPVLGAIKGFQLDILGCFALGAGLGLMAFSRLLSWLLHHYTDLMYALLTGFMLGALVKVWPWKETLSYRLNSQGLSVAFEQGNILPDSTNSEQILAAIGLCVIGIVCVYVIERLPFRSK